MTPTNNPQQIQSVGGAQDTVREQDKIMLVLAYLFPLSLIPLLTVKDSDFVKWHAKQGTALGAIAMVFHILIGATVILALLGCLTGPAVLVLCIMGIVKAFGGVRWRIPVIADLADKF